MGEPRVLRFDEIKTVERGGGSISRPLVGSWLDAGALTTGITTNPPGRAIAFHSHNVEEAVTVLEGDALCEFNGESFRLKPWDTTYIPAGIVHRFVNVGTVPMSILWVYATTHVTRTLASTGETSEHLSAGDLV
ncbi:MAG TPA: cupin domain-containing protein [Chloroflexota bacterium]